MRLLHIISSLDPAKGGPCEGVRRLAEGCIRQGHTVEVVTLDHPDSAFLAGMPFPVHACGPGIGKYAYTRKLLSWLRNNTDRFDAFVVNGLWQYHSRAAWLTLHRRHRYAVFPHGMLDPYFNRPVGKFLKKWTYWFLAERHLIADAHRVCFTTDSERQLAARSLRPYTANGMVVPYGIPGPCGDAESYRRCFYNFCPDVRGKRFLLYLGRIHPKKGCDLLVQAFAAVADPSLHLVMAGPDETGWRPKLEAKTSGISGRIHWTGMIAGDAKWGAFYAADAFILPSHQENFGIAVAEALACGLPVLISDQVNIFDEVQRDGAALVEPDTLAGTTALIRRWLATDAEERAAMRLAALRSFESRFSSQQLPTTIMSIFE
jgi:glycosyltransferase involved in cell wall biosynthesis